MFNSIYLFTPNDLNYIIYTNYKNIGDITNVYGDIYSTVPRVASVATWARARARGAGLSRTHQHTATCPLKGIDGIYPFSVTTKYGNLPLPFFGGNYPNVLLDNIY